MNFEKKLGHFLQNYGNPFFVGSLKTKETFFANKIAQKLFGVTNNNCNLNTIFNKSEEELLFLMERILVPERSTLVHDYEVRQADGQIMMIDFMVGYFDDEKTEVFLEMIPQQNNRLKMALNQIHKSTRPQAILNFDETLTIVDCNEAFHAVFDSSDKLRHSHFNNVLINGFLPEARDGLMASIFNTLGIGRYFSTKIKVYTATNEEYWYLLEMEKCTLDDSGMDKIMTFMTNIDKQVEIEEENSLLNQYLNVVQQSTVDLLYRVDIEKNILYHYCDLKTIELEKEIPNYVDVFMNDNVIHPDDQKKYLESFRNFYENDVEPKIPVRFSLGGQPYQWYQITGKKIYDSEGKLTEVFGVLVNVEEEQNLKAEFDQTKQYFDAFQAISGESFFTIDIETKTLTQNGDVIEELSMMKKTPDFPESVFHMVHPDHLESYKEYAYHLLHGICGGIQLRLLTTSGEFEWFDITSGAIYDKNGVVTEVVGKINNIQNKKTIETEFTSVNQYFTALQSMTGESFYTVDVKNKIFRQKGEVAEKLGIDPEFYNFPESFEYKIYPDDVEIFRDFVKKSMAGQGNSVQVRIKDKQGEFLWFEIFSEIMCDSQGDVHEFIGKFNNINSHKTMQEEVSALNQYIEAVQSLSGESLYYVDLKTMILRQKGPVALELGLPEEIPDYPEGAYGVIHPDDLAEYKYFAKSTLLGQDSVVEVRVKTATGEYQWYEIISKLIRDEAGEMREIFGRMTNIQSAKTMQAEFSVLNQYFMGMQELTKLIIYRIDVPTKTFRYMSEDAINFGVSVEVPDFIQTFIQEKFIHPDYAEDFRCYAENLLKGENQEHIFKARANDNDYEWFHIKSSFVYNELNNLVEIFGTMENIQQKKNLEERAYHDMMTGALNKTTFEEQARIMIEERDIQEKHGIIFIDLDDFKKVNDTLGHSYGDSLLTTVGTRLKRLVRGDDLVGRIGGDEFAVVLKNIMSQESVIERTNIMLQSLQRDFSFDNKVIGIKASVGVSIYPEHGNDYKSLISRADMAVYESKRRGKNVVSVYSKELEEK